MAQRRRRSVRSVPWLCLTPRSLAPVVVTCEHASRRLPEGLRATAAERGVVRAHWGWDLGGWALAAELARQLGTTAVGGRWSRLWIDLNRRVDEPTLIRTEAGGVALSWNAAVDAAERERRILDYHVPFHQQVDRLIVARLVRGIRPLVFAVHTFTPDLDGRPRRFEIGVLFDRDEAVARRLGRRLARAGLTVRYNRPYSGRRGMMYSADRHGRDHGLPCLELEVNQALFGDPRTVRRLGGLIAPLLPALVRS